VGDLTEKGLKEQNQPMSEHSFYMDSATSNLKNILQLHLFDRIWKSGNDAVKIWDCIDQSNLKEGITEFIKALHLNKYKVQKKKRCRRFQRWTKEQMIF
jgi:hypothetical protein